jgi:hypothetical protein
MLGDEMHDLPFPLDAPIDGQHAGGKDDAALLFEELWPDNEIGDAGLVFDGDEHDAFGRAWHLPDEDKPGGLNEAPVARLHRLDAGSYALPMQVFAQE